jgi:hypothetical protein
MKMLFLASILAHLQKDDFSVAFWVYSTGEASTGSARCIRIREASPGSARCI